MRLKVAFRNFANAPKKQNYNATSSVMELGPIFDIRCAEYFTGLL